MLKNLTATLALAFISCIAASSASQLPLRRVADITLPGNATRLDYQTLDAAKGRLFIAHLGDSQVIAVDTGGQRVLATVSNVSAVHGVLAVPEVHTLYASATGTNEVVAIDESTLKVKARMPGGVYPDGMAFDPVTRRLFVSDERGGTDTVIDTNTNRRVATIALGGEVGNTQYDPVSRHIFANVQTTGDLVEIDPNRNRVLRRIALRGCDGNHGLLIDAPNRRAFIACEDNATLVWLDMRDMRIIREWTIGSDPDVLALDPHAQRLYVASESGTVSVFLDGSTVSRLAEAYLAPAAHTVAVDPATHLVYFPLENIDGRPVLRVMRFVARAQKGELHALTTHSAR